MIGSCCVQPVRGDETKDAQARQCLYTYALDSLGCLGLAEFPPLAAACEAIATAKYIDCLPFGIAPYKPAFAFDMTQPEVGLETLLGRTPVLRAGRFLGDGFATGVGTITKVQFSTMPLASLVATEEIDSLPWSVVGAGVVNEATGIWQKAWTPSTPGFYLLRAAFSDTEIEDGTYSGLSYVYVAPDADFDNDNEIDGTDLNFWRAAFGPHLAADSDGDGDSDGADFLAWQRGLGPIVASHEQSEASGEGGYQPSHGQHGNASSADKVPEPNSIALIVVCCAFASARRAIRLFNR